MLNKKIDASRLEMEERVVEIRRVKKVVKGGRNFRFAALVVVGDKDGHVGFGTGKAMEVPDAIKKAVEAAKKNLITVPMVGTTVPHRIQGKFGSGEVLIMPAKEGTGVIAGGAARAILELAGYKDVRSKSLGSKNARNVVNATIQGLSSLRKIEDVAALRGKKVEELLKNEGVIRNKLKINAVITNAKEYFKLCEEFGSLDKYLWAYVNNKPIKNSWAKIEEVPAKTELSDKISKDLKKRGFKFVGSTIIYAFMQAVGMVNDHLVTCSFYNNAEEKK